MPLQTAPWACTAALVTSVDIAFFTDDPRLPSIAQTR